MNDILESIALAIIQGLTEFLPISSSGHLVLFEQTIAKLPKDFVHIMNVALHVGTMLSCIIIFRKEIINIIKNFFITLFGKNIEGQNRIEIIKQNNYAYLGWLIIIGSIPTALIGYFFEDMFKQMEENPNLVFEGIMFFVTGIVLLLTKLVNNYRKNEYKQIKILDSIIIGVVQGISIIPSISRSGTTISAGIFCSINRNIVGNYSFLLSLPAIAGALLLDIKNLAYINNSYIIPVIIGFFISFIVGIVALTVLLNFVKKGKLYVFSFYCFFIGVVNIIIGLTK